MRTLEPAPLDMLILTEVENIHYLCNYQTVGCPQIQALMVPLEGEIYFMTRLLELTNTRRSTLVEKEAYLDYESGIDKVCDLIDQRSPGAKVIGVESSRKRLEVAQYTTIQQ